MMPQLTIQIVGWNSGSDLAETCRHLKAEIPEGMVEYRFIDNGSSDGSADVVKNILPQCQVLELPENMGFAGGHNEGFKRCGTPLIMLNNPDMKLSWRGVKKLLTYFDDAQVGAVQGLLYRDEMKKIIDSAGIAKTLALNGRDRGAGKVDRGQFKEVERVWAVTGAAGIYRLKALEAVTDQRGHVFDENFFTYKEDVDLGWRLNRQGWKVLYVPVVQGEHLRHLKVTGRGGWGMKPSKIISRIRMPLTWISFRNWVWMVMKNATMKELLIHEIFIDFRIAVFMVISAFYPPSWGVWWEIMKGAGKMMAKRA